MSEGPKQKVRFCVGENMTYSFTEIKSVVGK